MKVVNIGGVPEHFNLAWYLTLKNKEYKNKGINLRWKDYYGGTGEMAQALRNSEIDLAVILTEGIIKDIIDGNPSKIIQIFVESPLIWGIHVGGNSKINTVEELKGKKAAISRFGSGSHLMAYVNAENNNWDLESDLNFEVVNSLDGAVESLSKNEAEYFMWERFTTKPIVDEGIFKHIGNCPTPWPCFVIAARNEFIKNEPDTIKTILEIINNTTSDFKHIPSIDRTIANRYEQKIEDVQEWLSLTNWSQENISKETINQIQKTLHSIDIIDKKVAYTDLVTNLN